MKKLTHFESRSTLSLVSTCSLVLLFFAGSALGLFLLMSAAQLPEFWKVSDAAGAKIYISAQWWGAALNMAIAGVVGFFGIKLANRCADVLLDRYGMR